MEPATLRRAPPAPAVVQVGLLVLLLSLAGAAWALTGARMADMDAGPGTDLGGLGWFMVGWVPMMAAMMLRSFAPILLAYVRIQEPERDGARVPATGPTGVFVAGYLLTWAAAGLLGYVLFDGARSLELGLLAWREGGRYVAAGVIAGAALYQLTTLQDACLRHCRSPVPFVRERRRPGPVGALWMGIEHGRFCLGCCWALMAALFALGVMSIAWMVLIAALIAGEKLLPWRAFATRGVALLLAVLAIAVALAPEDVPGLTIPGSP